MRPLLRGLAIEYDVVTYQINQKVIKLGTVYEQPLVWDIPTIERARLMLDKNNIKGAKIHKYTEYYYSDQEAQKRRLSALVDMGIITTLELELSTSNQPSRVAL